MPIAVSPNDEHEYVLEDDRKQPVENQTVFLLGTLTDAQTRHAERLLHSKKRGEGRDSVEEQGSVIDYSVYVCKQGLRGWRNFKTHAGEEVAFTRRDGQVTDESLAWVVAPYKMELAKAIREVGTVTRDEVGK